jgi:hypothetical protein
MPVAMTMGEIGGMQRFQLVALSVFETKSHEEPRD